MLARNNLGGNDAMVEQGSRPRDLFRSPVNLSFWILCLQTGVLAKNMLNLGRCAVMF